MESKKTVLIADTSEEFRAILADALKGEEGLEVIGQTGDVRQIEILVPYRRIRVVEVLRNHLLEKLEDIR